MRHRLTRWPFTTALLAAVVALAACSTSPSSPEAHAPSNTVEVGAESQAGVSLATEAGSRPDGSDNRANDDPSSDLSAPASLELAFWEQLLEPGSLFPTFETVGELANSSTAVIVGRITEVQDGERYQQARPADHPEEAPDLLGFSFVEFRVVVDEVVRGELPSIEKDSIVISFWRNGEAPALQTEILPGTDPLVFFVRYRSEDLRGQFDSIALAMGEDDAKRYIAEAESAYSLTTRQGLLARTSDGFMNPLVAADIAHEEATPDGSSVDRAELEDDLLDSLAKEVRNISDDELRQRIASGA